MIAMMVAMAKNACIGKNGTMPWHIPEELAFFKEKTMGHTIVMGKTTWNHMNTILPGRRVLVLTRQSASLVRTGFDQCYHSTDELLNRYQNSDDLLIVCGGATIYRTFLPYATQLWISYLPDHYDGDTFFPEFRKEDYKIVKQEEYTNFHFVCLEKIGR